MLGKSPNKHAFPYASAVPNVCLYMAAAKDSKDPAQHRRWDSEKFVILCTWVRAVLIDVSLWRAPAPDLEAEVNTMVKYPFETLCPLPSHRHKAGAHTG